MRFQLDPFSPTGVAIAPEPQKPTNRGGFAGSPDITRVLQPGTNVTFTGSGTQQSPYVVNASGGGGSGSPGGSNTQVQFNDSGNFGGDAGLTYNKTTDTLTVGGHTVIEGVTSTGATGTGKFVYDASPTIATPTIASFVNANHNHSNSAGGGQLTATTALNATGTPSSSTYLRGDNTWSTVSGGGGGGDMLASTYDPATISQQVLGTTATQTVTNKDLSSGTNTFPTFNQNTTGSAAKLTTARTIGTTTGDATSAGSSFDGSANNTNALTLATVNSNVGSFGSATQVPGYTVNAKGLITAASNTSIQIAESQVTSLTSDLALKAPLASPTFTGTVTVPTTTNSTDAAQKAYVDSVAQGLSVKGSVLVATAAALPTNTYLSNVITITATGTLTIDGTVTALNDRVLVKDESSGLKNGVYVVTTAGAIGVAAILTRSPDMDASAEFPGAFVFAESGTVNAAAGFVCTNSSNPTVGTTAITFTQFSGAGEITAGTGISKSGNTLSIDTAVTVDKTTAQTLTSKTLTSPVVNSPTGIVKGDVGLGNVDNTSDSTKNSASVALTNKDLTSGTNTFPTLNQSTTGSAATLTTSRTIGTLTGDATSTGSSFNGSANNTNALTLATVNSNVGSFGSTTAASVITVNAKGLVTAASSSTVTPAVGSITGLGTGVGTALAVNVGSAGAPVVLNGALGTPSSATLTNATGLVASTGTTATGTPSSSTYLRGDNTWATPAGSGTINSGTAGMLAYYASTGTAVSSTTGVSVSNGSLTLGVSSGVTPGDLTLAGNTSGTTKLQPSASATGTLTLPAATDTLVGRATTDTLTNKWVQPRVNTTASSATPAINTDTTDNFTITALAAAITSMTTNLSGTPTDGQKLMIRIKDNGTARAITWGASFVSSGVATLLATTVISKTHLIGLIYDSAAAKWVCVAVDATGY